MEIWPASDTTFTADNRHPNSIDAAYYFIFDGNEVLLEFNESDQWVPLSKLDDELREDSVRHYMGEFSGIDCFAVEAKLKSRSKGGLRSLIGQTDHFMFSLAGRAAQILDWYRTHQYCGKCGQKTEDHPEDRAMVCQQCSIHSYPRLSPSIITLVHNEGQVLLARNHRFPRGMYSTLAGFVEPGESIEETVHREVFEEVGVKVKNLEYLGSQPWAFPNSLMLGFLAEYDSGEIVLQEEEIADAQWFSCQSLPMIPGKVAISRWIIDTYLQRMGLNISLL
ncbi:MAG: NAD(+) diphosphatase [Pseudomonadales bacterium]|nr:NAD(+) diphosphatase [Pseudomonadales bacterium]